MEAACEQLDTFIWGPKVRSWDKVLEFRFTNIEVENETKGVD